MPFLIAKDFSKQIQSDNLNQVIGGDQSISATAQATALEEITSYLIQKYDLTNALQPSNPWANTQAYKAGNQVYLDASLYQPATLYVVGNFAVQAANFYICTTNTTGVFAPGSWTLIAPQYSFYFARYPYTMFNYTTQYAVGDLVFWKDSAYTCLIATQPLSQSSALQYGSYQNLPLLNVAPDNVNTGASYWGTGVAYSVPISTAITDTTKWTAGDNRSQQLVTYAVDITLYHLHSRIAPRNIPELRIVRRNEATSWLKAVSRGDITANIPELQPTQGARIRYGGNIKNTNSF
jgi:hypothetical protein